MRRMISKQLLALAAALCLVVCMMPARVQAADPVKYVALGDSITSGYGLDNKDTEAFPTLIANKKGYSVVNYGADGATSATLLANLSDSKVAADVASADVISITIGGNDLMGALYTYIAEEWNTANPDDQKSVEEVKSLLEGKNLDMLNFALGVIDYFATSPVAYQAVAEFTTNFGEVIAAVRGANPDVVLLVATQYNPYKWLPAQCKDVQYQEQVNKIAVIFDQGVSVLNKAINEGTKSGAYIVVDVYGAFNKINDNLSNAKYSSTTVGAFVIPSVELDFHPNVEGHKVIATTFEDKIVDVVSDTFNPIANAVSNLTNASVAQADITSADQAKAWAESQLKSVIPAGVSSEVVISDFVPASAGTAQNKAGTNGSFNVAVKLSWLGTLGTTEAAKVSIQATAYTEPAVNPGSGDDGKVNADKQTSQVNTTVSKNKSSVPKTGDTAEPMQYVVLILAAGIVAVTILRRKSVR